LQAYVENAAEIDPLRAFEWVLSFNPSIPEAEAIESLRKKFALTHMGARLLLDRLVELGRLKPIRTEGYEPAYVALP
jgi:hypothetical protein